MILIILIFTDCLLRIRHSPVSFPYKFPNNLMRQKQLCPFYLYKNWNSLVVFCPKPYTCYVAKLQFEHWHLNIEPTFSTTPWFCLANESYIHQLTDFIECPLSTILSNRVIETIKKVNAKLVKSLQSVATDTFSKYLSSAYYIQALCMGVHWTLKPTKSSMCITDTGQNFHLRITSFKITVLWINPYPRWTELFTACHMEGLCFY